MKAGKALPMEACYMLPLVWHSRGTPFGVWEQCGTRPCAAANGGTPASVDHSINQCGCFRPPNTPQDILAYEGGATLTVEGQELGPGDLKILRDFQPPAGTKPGTGRAEVLTWGCW